MPVIKIYMSLIPDPNDTNIPPQKILWPCQTGNETDHVNYYSDSCWGRTLPCTEAPVTKIYMYSALDTSINKNRWFHCPTPNGTGCVFQDLGYLGRIAP